jgi:hypothetical protein
MPGSKKSLSLVLLLAFCSNGIEMAAFRTAWSSVLSGSRNSPCPIHGNQCSCPDMCNAVKPLHSKPSCHSSQRVEQASPRASNASCSMKSRCNEKGEPINNSGSTLKDFLPKSNKMHSVAFAISPVMLSFHPVPLNRDLPSPFHPPRSS